MTDCACGCGESTAGGIFLPGHDQRLRTKLERRVGGLLSLARLVDAADDLDSGRATAEELARRIRELMPKKGPT